MNDAISRDAVIGLLLRIKAHASVAVLYETISKEMEDKVVDVVDMFAEMIQKIPAIDAVPVVRCKDCERRCTYKCPMYHTETCFDDLDGFDDYSVDKTDGNGFCHQGKRNGR